MYHMAESSQRARDYCELFSSSSSFFMQAAIKPKILECECERVASKQSVKTNPAYHYSGVNVLTTTSKVDIFEKASPKN